MELYPITATGRQETPAPVVFDVFAFTEDAPFSALDAGNEIDGNVREAFPAFDAIVTTEERALSSGEPRKPAREATLEPQPLQLHLRKVQVYRSLLPEMLPSVKSPKAKAEDQVHRPESQQRRFCCRFYQFQRLRWVFHSSVHIRQHDHDGGGVRRVQWGGSVRGVWCVWCVREAAAGAAEEDASSAAADFGDSGFSSEPVGSGAVTKGDAESAAAAGLSLSAPSAVAEASESDNVSATIGTM